MSEIVTSYNDADLPNWSNEKLLLNTQKAYEAYEMDDDDDGENGHFWAGLNSECERRCLNGKIEHTKEGE